MGVERSLNPFAKLFYHKEEDEDPSSYETMLDLTWQQAKLNTEYQLGTLTETSETRHYRRLCNKK